EGPMGRDVRNVCKDYSTGSGPLSVVRNVNLELRPGEALAVMGPSGSGKSTLLYILGTIDQPTSGSVRLNDTNPFALPESQLADFRNRNIGFVFQDHHLLPQCSVLENVLIPTLAGEENGSDAEEWPRCVPERVGLSPRLVQPPANLPGGGRQRVAVAGPLIPRPALLLPDEPTGTPARRTAAAVGQLLLDLHRQEPIMLLV